jgi:hypothetical protein
VTDVAEAGSIEIREAIDNNRMALLDSSLDIK